MKISKLKKPSNILRFSNNQLDIIREIKFELKYISLKIRSDRSRGSLKESLKSVIKDIKSELKSLTLRIRLLTFTAQKFKIKWFDTYKTRKLAATIQRALIINYKHLLLVIKKNSILNDRLLKSLIRNYRRILISLMNISELNLQAEILSAYKKKNK
jgi:hypothetical protein